MKRNTDPPLAGQTPFMMMVAREYEFLRNGFFNKLSNKSLSREDNEDVFHDTLLKCNDSITNSNITDEQEMKSYLYRSLKINGIREQDYHRNKFRKGEESAHNETVDSNAEAEFDTKAISNYIEANYGKDKLEIMNMYFEGYSAREIEEKLGISGVGYIISKITKKIRKEFS